VRPYPPLYPTPLQRSPRSIASFVSQFKATATRRINALRETTGTPVWQRNYYEHIVRDDDDLERIRAYIDDNPRALARG
jgi:putative transposase